MSDFAVLLTEKGIMELLLPIFSDFSKPHSIRTDATLLLSKICEGNEHNKDTFRELGGMESIINVLQTSQGNVSAFNGNSLLAIVQAIWSAIVKNKKSEAKFFLLDGLSYLLRTLEMDDSRLQPQVLGCLADIMQNKLSHIFFTCWNSDKNLDSAVQFVLKLWQREEKKRNVIAEKNGCIMNLFDPLVGGGIVKDRITEDGGQQEGQQPPRASDRLRQALEASKLLAQNEKEEILQRLAESTDIRGKIFSILSVLGFENINREGLSDDQNVTLCLIESYCQFTEGQEWQRLKSLFAENGLKPILADRLIIESVLEKSFNTGSDVKCKQLNYAKKKQEKEHDLEKRLTSLTLLQKNIDKGGDTSPSKHGSLMQNRNISGTASLTFSTKQQQSSKTQYMHSPLAGIKRTTSPQSKRKEGRVSFSRTG